MRSSSLVLLGALLSTATAEPPITFTRFDQNHSTIGFGVPILGGLSEVQGRFRSFTATLVYDPQDVTRGSVDATIDASSIDTGIPDAQAIRVDIRQGTVEGAVIFVTFPVGSEVYGIQAVATTAGALDQDAILGAARDLANSVGATP